VSARDHGVLRRSGGVCALGKGVHLGHCDEVDGVVDAYETKMVFALGRSL
jgi:hypothetical protein